MGTGFTEKTKQELSEKFEKLVAKTIKIKNKDKISKDMIFLKPLLVAEIQFSEITKDGKLRQASYLGLREDKKAKDVVLESKNERKS